MVQRIKTGMIADGAVTTLKMNEEVEELFGFRNRIINGDMRIDQRNAGASVTPVTLTYTVDRWAAVEQTDGSMTVQQSSTAPAGFTNSLLVTVTSADSSLGSTQYSVLRQAIEGFNVADFNWGTVNARPITVSFWVRSSVTGTFGGSIQNAAQDRSYPFSYTIGSANTFEYKTITIPGDTSGTWLSNNGVGLQLWFSFGSGSTYSGTANAWASSLFFTPTGATNLKATNGATWQVTGVQLEVGSVATPFERRPFGMELVLCQRYYQQIDYGNHNGGIAANWYQFYIAFPVVMRTDPTMTTSARGSNTGNAITLQDSGSVNGWTLDISNTTSATIRGPNESVSRGHFGRGKFSAEL
jgi:hypothetical protein